MSRSLSAALALVIALPAPARAQSSRVEAIADEQAAKAEQLSPEGPPTAERVVLRVMKSPLLAGSGGVYPWIGSLYNGTGLAGGAGYLRRAGRGQRLLVAGAVSVNGSARIEGSWRLPTFRAGGLVRPKIDARWSRLQAVPFYGIGLGASDADRSTFDFDPTEVDAGLAAAPTRWLSLSATYGYLGLSTRADAADPRARPLTGINEALKFGVARVAATVDWRTSPGYSTRGGAVRTEWQRYHELNSRPYSFDRFEIDASHLVPLLREQYVLAFRALATATTINDAGDDVPFILLPSIGGGDTVRGAANRRFHDRNRLVLTGEYRWRPSRVLDMAVFVDAGTVASRFDILGTGRFTRSWGIGARFHGPATTALRLELARGDEGWRTVFAAGQPF